MNWRPATVALATMLATTGAIAQVPGAPTAPLPTAAPVTAPADPPPPPARDLPLPVFTPQYPYSAVPDASALAAIPRAETLAQAIAHSYETNPRLLAERATVRSTDFAYPAARGAYGPQIDLRAGYAFTRDRSEIIPGLFVGDQGWTSTAAAIVTMPLLTFGRNAAGEADALARIDFSRDVLRLTEAEVLSGVVGTYVGVLRDAGAVAIANENLALLDRQLSDSAQRFAVREITSSDLQQVETRVELGRAQLLQAQGQLGRSQAEFLRFVGLLPGDLAPPDVLRLPVATLEEAYAVADRESPVIRAAQSREKISRAAVEAAKAEFAPRVDLRGTADYGTLSDYSDSRRTTQLRGDATLTVPLMDSGVRAAQLGRAREANTADWRLIESAERDTRSAVAGAWNDLAGARASLDRYREAAIAAQRAYEGAVIQEKAGARTTLDVLDLARDLLTVRTSYNIALSNEYLARTNLLAAIGRLEAPLLVSGMAAYDPQTHFQSVRRNGDIPLLTAGLSALDGIVAHDTGSDRPNTDPAAALATGAAAEVPANSR